MQSAAFLGVQSSACPRSFRQQRPYTPPQQLASRRSCRRQTRILAPTVVSSALALDVGTGTNFQALTNILSAVIVGAGAWYYYRTQVCALHQCLPPRDTSSLCTQYLHALTDEALHTQMLNFWLQNFDKDGRQVCPRCHGTGVVECFCQRWSDNDVGCGTCGGSGKMVCNSCNGGGTAVPIEAKIHIEPRKKINDSYYPSSQQRCNCQQCTCRQCSCSKRSLSTPSVSARTHCAGC